ncbi:hypothetical protein BDZ94DRAFT_1326422 [Collybia nuda]|uniref:ADF-H domain-containing protein n=1 Tax=Collybia nuda TaxID=64659 RepID=A0A9P5XUG1_9AGAR|nr:hypothetical protein BDZ94DRAFT_1326422 [Collybia nuda]
MISAVTYVHGIISYPLTLTMSATSGITVAPELVILFANANSTDDIRFLKLSIAHETIVHDMTIPANSSFENDLILLQNNILQPNIPAYVLAKIAPSNWVEICYVPDSSKVRDKMLYASTRTSLLKTLGSTLFTDSIFATSTVDLTPEAYASHRRHLAAPKPLSLREQEMAEIRAAESGNAYGGSRARVNHIGTGVGLVWSREVEDAVRDLGAGSGCAVVVVKIDSNSEMLTLAFASEITIESLGPSLPVSEPCYAFFAWPHTHTSPSRREIIFIYSCPSNSPIKYRMVYSSGATSTFTAAKSLLLSPSNNNHVSSRKIETSDPIELNEAYILSELEVNTASKPVQPVGADSRVNDEQKLDPESWILRNLEDLGFLH